MALGPKTGNEQRDVRIKQAEDLIDADIKAHGARRIVIETYLLPIAQAEWEEFLKPQYLEAGWTTAEWVAGVKVDELPVKSPQIVLEVT